MEFEDDAFVLSARPFGEAGAIVELLTRAHGKYAAHVAGGASRRMKPFLQAIDCDSIGAICKKGLDLARPFLESLET